MGTQAREREKKKNPCLTGKSLHGCRWARGGGGCQPPETDRHRAAAIGTGRNENTDEVAGRGGHSATGRQGTEQEMRTEVTEVKGPASNRKYFFHHSIYYYYKTHTKATRSPVDQKVILDGR